MRFRAADHPRPESAHYQGDRRRHDAERDAAQAEGRPLVRDRGAVE